MPELNWTEQQNTMVRDLIAEEIEKARLSHKFIPELKLSEDARSVSADRFDANANTVDDISTIPLVEVAAPVSLSKLQAEDADLSAALLLIRRAANRLARAHDGIVFIGQPGVNQLHQAPPFVNAIGGTQNDGVSDTDVILNVELLAQEQAHGESLVRVVADGLVQLEGLGYIGSYVLVLGQRLFTDANTPSPGSLVLPKDRLEGLLGGGPVHRSSVLGENRGLLLSLGGEPMDRAVAVEPKFEFLRIGANEVRECRVFERFALRLKERNSVVGLNRIPVPAVDPAPVH